MKNKKANALIYFIMENAIKKIVMIIINHFKEKKSQIISINIINKKYFKIYIKKNQQIFYYKDIYYKR